MKIDYCFHEAFYLSRLVLDIGNRVPGVGVYVYLRGVREESKVDYQDQPWGRKRDEQNLKISEDRERAAGQNDPHFQERESIK